MSKPPERLNISKALGGQWVAFDGNHGWDFIRPTILPARVSLPPFWRGVCCGLAVFGILDFVGVL